MISALNAIEAKMKIIFLHIQRKKSLHFPSVQMVLKDNASAFEILENVAVKYCLVLKRLGVEFENRF